MKKNRILILTLLPIKPIKSGYQNTVFHLHNELKKKFNIKVININNINKIDPIFNLKHDIRIEKLIENSINLVNPKYIFVNTSKLFFTYKNLLIQYNSKCILICHDLYNFRKKYFSTNLFTDLTPLSKKNEITILNSSKFIIDFSNYEFNFMKKNKINQKKLINTMTPIKINNFKKITDKEYDFLFIGSNLKQNKFSLERFLSYLKNYLSNKKLCIIGTKAKIKTKNLNYKKFAKKNYFRNSTIGIAPIYTGTGRNVKIFEMMAYGLPVVTNINLDKYGLIDGYHYILVKNINSWKTNLDQLLLDDKLRNIISYNGWKWVKKNCNPNEAFKRLINKL